MKQKSIVPTLKPFKSRPRTELTLVFCIASSIFLNSNFPSICKDKVWAINIIHPTLVPNVRFLYEQKLKETKPRDLPDLYTRLLHVTVWRTQKALKQNQLKGHAFKCDKPMNTLICEVIRSQYGAVSSVSSG